MIDPHRSVLTEPLLSVYGAGRASTVSLPDALARLARGEALVFGALRPHQSHAWHAFLVQTAAAALHRAGAARTWLDEDEWRGGLLGLTHGQSEAWTLVVDDLSRPALLQPPVPEGSLTDFKVAATEPDALDSLVVTSVNHNAKRHRMRHPRPEHWLFALVDLQTMQGFSGRDLYGIARMNSGFGNRPAVSLAAQLDAGSRFQRDLRVWLDARQDMEELFGIDPAAGAQTERVSLAWTVPWDGTTSLGLDDVDPFVVEVCRRIRLAADASGALRALARPTKARRIEAESMKGNLGDPWIPIKKGGEPEALTLSGKGWHYSLLWQVWFGSDWQQGAALKPRQEDGESPWLTAQALARGQGKTDGWHERRIAVPAHVGSRLSQPEERDRLAVRAALQMKHADSARVKVLRTAALALQQGAPDKVDLSDRGADVWTARLDRVIDTEFFPHLWDRADSDEAAAEAAWCQRLADLVLEVFREAARSTPLASARRYRVLAEAEARLHQGCLKHLHTLPVGRPLGEPAASDSAEFEQPADESPAPP